MKKMIFATAAIAAMLAASCSNEDVQAPAAGGNVSFTVMLPEMASRADFGDGTTAKKLTYYVYDAEATGDTKTVLFDGTADFGADLHATVQLDLVTGKTYDIVFWADSYGDAAGRPYTYDGASQTVTVTYGTDANAEARDAFYFTEKALKISGPVSKPVTLKRPFAQLNVGTSDFEAAEKAGLTLTQTGMYIADMPNTLNLYDGTVGGSVKAEFTLAALPDGEDFPVEAAKYKYLTMNYVLVGADKTTVDVHLTSDINASADRQDVAFTAVPVQRNYRTNIFGALLTDPTTFDVVISEGFDGAYNNGVLTVDVKPGEDIQDIIYSNKNAEVLTLNLPEGEFDLVGYSDGKLIFNGSGEGTKVTLSTLLSAEEALEFINCNIDIKDNFSQTFIPSRNIEVTNCTLECPSSLYIIQNSKFEKCKFVGTCLCMTIVDAEGIAGETTFTDCEFEVTGMDSYVAGGKIAKVGNAVQIGHRAAPMPTKFIINFNGCSFKGIDVEYPVEEGGESAAIAINAASPFDVNITNCTMTGFENMYSSYSGTLANVWVDGEQVVTAQP